MSELGLSSERATSLVPLTVGGRPGPEESSWLVAVWDPALAPALRAALTQHPQVTVVRTARLTLSAGDVVRIFGRESGAGGGAAANKAGGPVLALHLTGPLPDLQLERLPGALAGLTSTQQPGPLRDLFGLVDMQRGF